MVDPKKRSVEAAIDTEDRPLGRGLARRQQRTSSTSSDKLLVTVIDLKTRKLVGRVQTPTGTQGIAASPDGKHVLVADYGEPTLLVIDTAKDVIVDKIALQGNPKAAFKPRYSPDGSKILRAASRTESSIS